MGIPLSAPARLTAWALLLVLPVQLTACRDSPEDRVEKLFRARQEGGESLRQAAADGLVDPAASVRATAAWMLAEEDDGAGELVGLLSDPAPSVRAAAAGALMRFRDASLWPAVAPLLQDHDPRVRLGGVVLIAACSPEAAGELLVGALNDPDPDVRLEAAGGLRAAPSVEALPELTACLLGDADWRVRARAVEALSLRDEAAEIVSLFGDEAEIVSVLELASADSNPLVRAAAGEGLEAYHRAHPPIIAPIP